MEVPNVVIITQARTGSSRLPGKVLLEVDNESLLLIHLKRLINVKSKKRLIVATTDKIEDQRIVNFCQDHGFEFYAGSENDVLDRFYQSVKDERPDWIVRVTSDCPLIDSRLVDAVINCAIVNDVDYCSNGLIERFPDGQDVEVFKFTALETAWRLAKLPSEREHVTPYIRNNRSGSFISLNFPCRSDYSKVRMTVDEAADFEVIKAVITVLGKEATWLEYTNYLLESEIANLNSEIVRNEGYLKSLKND